MRIGIDIRKYYDFGIGTYIQNLITEFEKKASHTYFYFASTEQKEKISALHSGTILSNNSKKYSLQELFSLSSQANTNALDIFHAPHYTLPVRLHMPSVVTIHDIIHLRFPENFSTLQRTYATLMIRHACVNSKAIIVVSEFTKNDLLDRSSIPESKIHVVHSGIHQRFSQQYSQNEIDALKTKHGIFKPFILYVGSVKPHKNINTLLNAFARIRHSNDVQIVFMGETFEKNPSLTDIVEQNNIQQSVLCLGKLSDHDVAVAYQAAAMAVLPSLYEGFGFSILEAMASGTPVIGARAASIPEIMGNGGKLFDPHNVDELTELMNELLESDTLRNELVECGYKNVAKYSWERCAQETLQVYESVAL